MAVETPPLPGQQDIHGGEEPVRDVPLDEVRVTGPTALGLHESGGKAPTSATLSLSAGTIALEHGTAFEKGQTVVFHVVAVVTGVHQDDKIDKPTGIAMECVQKHKAKLTDIRLIDHS